MVIFYCNYRDNFVDIYHDTVFIAQPNLLRMRDFQSNELFGAKSLKLTSTCFRMAYMYFRV